MVTPQEVRLITNKAILTKTNKLAMYELIMGLIRALAEQGKSEIEIAPDVDLVPCLHSLGYQIQHKPEKVIISW